MINKTNDNARRQYASNYTMLCTNCGSKKHSRRKCTDPITSWGVILVHVDKNYVDITNQLSSHVHVLLVSRKYSLGYIEFVRGRYTATNKHYISTLAQQMRTNEIAKILKCANNFDDLWNDFWQIKSNDALANHNADEIRFGRDAILHNEYTMSKTKFEQVFEDVSATLIFSDVQQQSDEPELGFPKGRRIKHESGKECAVREFCEETGYSLDKIKIIDNIKPIEENMIGTNGVPYRHIYYIAETTTEETQVPIVESNEVGNAKFYSILEAVNLIRKYHTDKIKILLHLLSYFSLKLNADHKKF